jgi:hypothetical protein
MVEFHPQLSTFTFQRQTTPSTPTTPTTPSLQLENNIMSKSISNIKPPIPDSFVDGSNTKSSLCNAMKIISDSELGTQFVLAFFATEFKTTSAVTGMKGRLFPGNNILSNIISLVTTNKFMVCSFCFPHAIHSRNLFSDCSDARYSELNYLHQRRQ